MTKNIPEIVAPGGSYTKAIVAAMNGAEAVYLGVPFTSLRMVNNKIRLFDELDKTISKLHSLGTKAYLTMNIFARNIDLKLFEKTLERLQDLQKPDGIIFSDPGGYRLIRKYFPNIRLHLSTQTSTMNYESVKFWRDLGVSRIVLARELTLKEIEQIKKEVPEVELEVFVHWAMCMTFSWRCLLGEFLQGRESNKGNCGHTCRHGFKFYIEEEGNPGKLFQLVENKRGSYILSSKDLCTIERLGEILPVVDALKIEGRSKSEFYVASTVKAYRHVRDSLTKEMPMEQSIKNLVYQIPHRRYWEWFLFHGILYAPDSADKSPDYDLSKTKVEYISQEQLNQRVSSNSTSEDERFDDVVDTQVWPTLSSITYDTAWPVNSKLYYGLFLPEFKELNGHRYIKFVPKQLIYPGDIVNVIIPKGNIEKVQFKGFLNELWEKEPKATVNHKWIRAEVDKMLSGWEVAFW